MFNNAHGNITVSTFFDTRRAVSGSDKFPVKIRQKRQARLRNRQKIDR